MGTVETSQRLEIVPSGVALCAEVVVDDLRTIDEATAKAIEQAWFEHSVLLFRNQTLSDLDLIR